MGRRDDGFDATTLAHDKPSSLALVTVSDEEVDEVMLVPDSRYDSGDTVDAVKRNFCVSMLSSEVAPQEPVTMLGDDFIDNDKMDEATDGEAIVAPTTQGNKHQFSHAKAKPKGLSSNRTASRTVNLTRSVCSLVKRAGKTKSGVSTPEKTKNASTKKQDKPTNRADAEYALDQVPANEFIAKVTTNRGCDSFSIACKESSEDCWEQKVRQRDQPQTPNQTLRMRSDGLARVLCERSSCVAFRARSTHAIKHRRVSCHSRESNHHLHVPRATFIRTMHAHRKRHTP